MNVDGYEMMDFDNDRYARLAHYNRDIQKRRGCNDAEMAEYLGVGKDHYIKNLKFKPPGKIAEKYAKIHYDLGVSVDRYLADDRRFELFVEDNIGIMDSEQDFATELKRCMRCIDAMAPEEEKFLLALENIEMLVKWLTYQQDKRIDK